MPKSAAWHPIVTAPHGERLLVYASGGPRFAIKDELGNWRNMMGHPVTQPKWWMPVPRPPGYKARERRQDAFI